MYFTCTLYSSRNGYLAVIVILPRGRFRRPGGTRARYSGFLVSNLFLVRHCGAA